MLKKLSVTAVILAMSAMLLVPTAYAVQSVDAPAQEEENCIKTLLELLAGDTEKNESAGQEVCSGKTVLKYRMAGYTTIRMASWMSISPVLCKSETLCTICRQKAA